MSMFFRSILKNSTRQIISKYKEYKHEYKLYNAYETKKRENNKTNTNTNFNQNNKNDSSEIRKNPFYWTETLGVKLKQFFNSIFNRDNGPKMLNSEESTKHNTAVESVKSGILKLSEISMKSSVILLESINKMVVTVTFGYLDIRKVLNTSISPMIKQFPTLVRQKINYHNFMILYRKMGQYVTKANQKTINYMDKYKDHKSYDEFKNYYDNYIKNIEQKTKQSGQHSKFGKFFNKYLMPSSFLNMKMLLNRNLKKVDNYVNSPSYKKNTIYYVMQLKKLFKNRNDYLKYFRFSNYRDLFSNKNMPSKINITSYAREYLSKGMKNKTRKLLFYIVSIFLAYYTIKYLFYRVTVGRQDKNLKQALHAIQDLKNQNEELMKYNRELIDKINNDVLTKNKSNYN